MKTKHLGIVASKFTHPKSVYSLMPICLIKAENKPDSRCLIEALYNL